MRIGIITINSAYNYGCVLQAYALQEYLVKCGHKVDLLNYRPDVIDKVYTLYREKIKFKTPVLQNTYDKLRRMKQQRERRATYEKAEKFEKFIKKTLHTGMAFKSFDEIKENYDPKDYDLLITGSDQVWNSDITKGLKPAYFLDFDKEKTEPGFVRRISYAPSIGVDFLRDSEADFMKKYLENYDMISVREQSAAELLSSLTDKPIKVVSDPTFLLEREDYESLVERSGFTTPEAYNKKFKGPYILVHVIGKDRDVVRIAGALSRRLGLPVIQNRRDKTFDNELGTFASAGPEEFIGLVRGAKYVVTNSFHATVFALLYHRNFITVPHKKYPERMVNLLGSLGVEGHLQSKLGELVGIHEDEEFIAANKNDKDAMILEKIDSMSEDELFKPIDFDEVDARWAKLREDSQGYLKDALSKVKM